jgi:hypothetical protein
LKLSWYIPVQGLRQAALTSGDAEAGRAFRRHRAYFCKVPLI